MSVSVSVSLFVCLSPPSLISLSLPPLLCLSVSLSFSVCLSVSPSLSLSLLLFLCHSLVRILNIVLAVFHSRLIFDMGQRLRLVFQLPVHHGNVNAVSGVSLEKTMLATVSQSVRETGANASDNSKTETVFIPPLSSTTRSPSPVLHTHTRTHARTHARTHTHPPPPTHTHTIMMFGEVHESSTDCLNCTLLLDFT